MLVEGVLSSEEHAVAISFVGLHGGRAEDALIENGLMTEAEMLKYVSTLHGTRFVSTEKLYKAQIDPALLQLVPRKLADLHGVLPVLYDEKRVLSVVTADPDNLAALQEVSTAASIREVVPLVARPAAVRAAIQKAYFNDPTGFAALLRTQHHQQQVSLSVEPTVNRFASGRSSQTGPSPLAQQIVAGSIPLTTSGNFGGGGVVHDVADPFGDGRRGPAHGGGPDLELHVAPPPAPRAPPGPPPRRGPPAPPEGVLRQPQPSRPEVAPAPEPPKPAAPAPPPVTLTTDYVETLNVLVSLLENTRPDLRGHSAQCARLMKRLADRMGLSPVQGAALAVAAYIHDIGKAGTYHLTALNVAEYDGHKTAAQKVATAPERYLQIVALHAETKAAVQQMYERFDGKGFPAGVANKDISLGARMLAVVDSYADITSNPKNPARRVLNPAEAVQFLGRHKGTIFDPSMVDLLGAEVAGDDLRAKLLADRFTVLLVDPDPEETMVLELRLLEAGFEVRIARTAQQATLELSSRDVTAVVSEIDLDVPDAGLTLRGQAAGADWGQKVLAWVVHTRKMDRQLAEIVFDLGVDDMVSKPTPPDVFVTKIRQLIDRKQRQKGGGGAAKSGVSGTLSEMGLPELVQVLWHGRKTCAVRLKTKRGAGDITFSDGQIVDARFIGKRGEDAFYAMLALQDGEFQIDNTATVGERTIDASPEGLLLEGMRRMDEGLLG
jgi:response regulator RpfG family c-di-GMP phosphodiesterase